MFDVKIEKKAGFIIAGHNMQLPIQSSEDIEKLFGEAHKSGVIAKLSELSAAKTDSVTNATYLGIAKPKPEGGIDYYFAAEVSKAAETGDLEIIPVPTTNWAIFTSEGANLENIARLEQYAYGEWLQGADWKLVDLPQMNAFFFDNDKEYMQLWLPVTEKTKIAPMKVRPYLTYAGQCTEAIALYERAFKAELIQIARFWEMPSNPGAAPLSDVEKDLVFQAIMRFGKSDFIRMSDCHGRSLNENESERVSIVVETTEELVRHAFAVLSEEGRVGIELSEQIYSSCTGVVFDKFGVMWNLVTAHA